MENSTTNNDEKSINTSMSLVNNITIDCLMNTSRYNKCKEYLLNSKNLEFNRDKKFYRKRIISLTKELFHNNEEYENLIAIFNSYIKQLIIYFKEIDRKDIIQCDYNSLEMNDNNSHQVTSQDISNIDNLILRDSNIKEVTLDKYVKVTQTNERTDKEIIPLKKDINLRDPSLRRKGLKNKISENNKNINK